MRAVGGGGLLKFQTALKNHGEQYQQKKNKWLKKAKGKTNNHYRKGGQRGGGWCPTPPPDAPKPAPPPWRLNLCTVPPPPDQIFDKSEKKFAAFGGERENFRNFCPKTTFFQALLCKKCVKSTYFFRRLWRRRKFCVTVCLSTKAQS